MNKFILKSKYSPTGDQPKAIRELTEGLTSNAKHQTLLGVTGSGKTFTIANVVENVNRPTLVLAHNKTLAAQLFSEFSEFFPENAVRYFVSYYDYYQPEAYLPRRDLYIEKESDINEEIEKYRNAATQSLLTRRDVLIVASVSCIYGLGDPDNYQSMAFEMKLNENYMRSKLLRRLSDLQYERSDYDFKQGLFRVRGDLVDIFPSYDDYAIRLEFYGDILEKIIQINPLTGEVINKYKEITIFPAKQFVTPFESLKNAIPKIRKELEEQIKFFKRQGRDIEAHRIRQRVEYDIEMLEETGYCSGIENYSRFIDGRTAGDPPSTLLDYFPDDSLFIVDESHITLPQVRGMYNGDLARKSILVDYGFRLPAAKDNRPLKFEEFLSKINQVIYTSATPNEYELDLSRKSSKAKDGGIVEQIVRPTGLLDPVIEVRPTKNQIDDIVSEVNKNIAVNQRTIITTLTKRMAEELSNYLKELKIKVNYLHSEIDTIERVEILRDLRYGVYDVLVGVNLLREGIDLPETSLVIILDTDKEGFLRSGQSLVQIVGRAARHLDGRVIMYGDKITKSMKFAISETNRRRKIQDKYNKDNNITPQSIEKEIKDILTRTEEKTELPMNLENLEQKAMRFRTLSKTEKKELISALETEMLIFADMLKFEEAARIRDILNNIKK